MIQSSYNIFSFDLGYEAIFKPLCGTSYLPRKEVIQPHLPVRLPCYDFTPVTGPAFGCSAPFGFGHRLRAFPAPMV